MKRFLDNLKSGLTIGLGFMVMVIIGGTIYAAVGGNEVISGETLTAQMWNDTQISIQEAAPSNAVMAFALPFCPSGWLPADGNNGTPDLRGVFIRGLNDFGTGVRTDEYRDVDGINRTIGSFQVDEIKEHRHLSPSDWDVGGRVSDYTNGVFGVNSNTNDPRYTGLTGGSETRPKNIALIYCIKE